MSASNFSSNLQSAFATKGFTGPKLLDFCNAVGQGVVSIAISLTGQISTPAGIGVSSGSGISVPGSDIGDLIKTTIMGLFGSSGPNLADITDAIGEATETELGNASLSSDTNGSATFSSFSGAISSMENAIETANSFAGGQWPNMCLGIATGICNKTASDGAGSLSGASGTGAGSGSVVIS